MGRRRNCRLWWPSNLFSQTPPNRSFLFGWFLPSSEASFDVVVAFSCDELKLISSLNSGFDLQEILQKTNKRMPAFLQDKSKISLLGYLTADFSGNNQLVSCRNDGNKYMNSSIDRQITGCMSNHGSWSCGCSRYDGMLEQRRLAALENLWIKLVYGVSDTKDGRILFIPKLDHLHLNSETISLLDLHVCNIL